MLSSRAFAAVHVDQVGSPIVLFSPSFASSKSSIKEAILAGLLQLNEQQASLVSKMEYHVRRRLQTDNVQHLIRVCKLTQLEAESVLWYTADFRTLDPDGSEDFNVYFLFNLALRNRSLAAIKRWSDFAWFLVNALRKLPAVKVDVFRGVPQRITALSANYGKGKRVVWTSFTSTTVNRDEIMKSFGQGGTFMHIEVLDGRDISQLSMLPQEKEVLLMPNVQLLVDSVLSADEAAKFSTKFGGALPQDVDLILMKQVETEAQIKQDSTSFDSVCVAPAGASPSPAAAKTTDTQVDATLAAMLAQSGISSLAPALAAHGFTTAEDVLELAQEQQYLAELVAQLGLTMRDKMKLDKMLKALAGGAGPGQGHGAVAAATSQVAKMSISGQAQQALEHVKQAFPDVNTAADLDRIIPGQEQKGDTPLHSCARTGNVQLVGHCLAAGCYVDIQNALGGTPLHLAAHNGHVPVVDRLLAAKCNMNKPANTGATPLYIAAQNGHPAVVERLVAASANVNTPTTDGSAMTPLAIAASEGHVEVVRALRNAGADKTAVTKWGTALKNAQDCVKDKAKLKQLEDLLR